MWLYLVLSAFLVAYVLFKRTYSYWDRNGVPSVPGLFIVGSIWEVLRKRKHLGLLAQEWYQKFSNVPYFGYYNGAIPVLMIRDADIVKDVLIKDFNSFSINYFRVDEELDPLLGANSFFATGAKWKHTRSTISPLFSTSKVKSVFPLIKTTCAKLEEYLSEHGSENLEAHVLAAKFTTENSIMCGFTFNAESFTNPDAEFNVIGRKIFEQSTLAEIQFVRSLFLSFLDKYLRIPLLPKDIDAFFRKFTSSNIASRKNAPAEDFLQMLLQTAESKKLTENEIIGFSLTMFIEGFETSSAVISYGMFELARNPDIQSKLYQEIASVLNEFNDDFSFDSLQKMEYLDAIIYETLRMYPALLALQKVCTEPYEFRPIPGKKTGYKMPIGGAVAIPVHAIHRDPEYYPDPDVFKPERFLPEQRQTINKATFLGFGEGPRMCVGMRFGQTQAKAALATIVKSFHIKLSPDTKPYKIDPGYFMNTSLDPILLNFEKRKIFKCGEKQ